MVVVSNECCDCATPGYPCIGDACYLRHYVHHYCDKCGDDVDTLYWFEGEQLCSYCVLNSLEEVDDDE